MALVVKTSPVGVDVLIGDFQKYLFNSLGFANWDSYHRVYINPSERGLIPERYEGNNEYNEVFYNDNFDITTWFFVASERPITDGGLVEVTVSMIVQADIQKLYPLVDHRADEELNNAIQLASESYVKSSVFELETVKTTIDKVYQEFDKSQINFEDMSNQYVARFEYKARYTPDCVS